MQLLPMASSPDGPISARYAVITKMMGGGKFKFLDTGVGRRPWWLALLACGGAYWPLALEPSAMTSRHPH